jgi:dCMP deaminase
MILALTGTDKSLEEELAAFLEVRSFERIASTALDCDPSRRLPWGRHYVLTGVMHRHVEAHINYRGFRLVFLGDAPKDAGELSRLHGRADAHFTRSTSEQEIVRFVSEAMASVPRPGWDAYFIDIARVTARRSNCMKRQVAAVVVRDKRVVATGYNGTPRGAKNCDEGGCERCNSLSVSGQGLDDCVCNHAEENAICQAAYHGISIRGATLYCTHSPCLRCAKLLINAGIEEVVFNADYPMSERAGALLDQCGVTYRKYEKDR